MGQHSENAQNAVSQPLQVSRKVADPSVSARATEPVSKASLASLTSAHDGEPQPVVPSAVQRDDPAGTNLDEKSEQPSEMTAATIDDAGVETTTEASTSAPVVSLPPRAVSEETRAPVAAAPASKPSLPRTSYSQRALQRSRQEAAVVMPGGSSQVDSLGVKFGSFNFLAGEDEADDQSSTQTPIDVITEPLTTSVDQAPVKRDRTPSEKDVVPAQPVLEEQHSQQPAYSDRYSAVAASTAPPQPENGFTDSEYGFSKTDAFGYQPQQQQQQHTPSQTSQQPTVAAQHVQPGYPQGQQQGQGTEQGPQYGSGYNHLSQQGQHSSQYGDYSSMYGGGFDSQRLSVSNEWLSADVYDGQILTTCSSELLRCLRSANGHLCGQRYQRRSVGATTGLSDRL